MKPEWVSILIAGIGLFISVGSTLGIVSYKMGRFTQKQADMEKMVDSKADRADITAIKETLAEIKGMFVLRLRE